MGRAIAPLAMTVMFAVALVLGVPACARIPVEPRPQLVSDEVFDRYMQARGGEAALAGMRVIERIGWIAVSAGKAGLLAGSYHTCLRYPDRVAIEIDAGPWQLAQTLRTGGTFECSAGFRECKPASGEIARELRDTALRANKELLSNKDAWRSARIAPGRDAQSIRLDTQTGHGKWAEFDKRNGHLIAEGDESHWRRFGQWRDVGGIHVAHRLEDYATPNGEWRNTVQLQHVVLSAQPSAWCVARFGD